MRSILISDEVWGEIAKRGKFGETEDGVLRREFGLPQRSAEVGTKPGSSQPHGDAPTRLRREVQTQGRRQRFATKRMSAFVRDSTLVVSFEAGPSKSFPLAGRSDKQKLREVRDAAVLFARNSGASYGQEMAVKKALTEAGYHLMWTTGKT